MTRFASRLVACSAAGVLFAVSAGTPAAAQTSAPPAAPREFRAAWVATVNNIDWPSKKGLSVADQKREIIAICDRAVALKLNCLIVQVRTTCDALYPSTLEPWSAYLTGTPGKAPSPMYDPLQMWIDEGHKRGIEIHAWFNPYRARMDTKVGVAEDHISKTHPNLVVEYGDKLWLNPGEPLAAKRSLDVFMDVVRRYDVDGIHIDDYFYPYPVQDEKTKQNVPFPDDASWARYKQKNPLKPGQDDDAARADWRRQSVNQLVEQIYASTKRIKPHVKFGISPFGIGRKGKVPGIAGFDQYESLYADAALWLQRGWCDYYTPQLYWPIEQKAQSFPVLLKYWESENAKNRHLWPGLFTSKLIERRAGPGGAAATTPSLWTAGEIRDQIEVTRAQGKDPGHVHFSMKALMGNADGLGSLLQSSTYATSALIPASPWLDNVPPPKPTAKLRKGKAVELQLTPGRGEATWQWAIWKRVDGKWTFQSAPGDWRTVTLEPGVSDVVVTAVDRVGNESPRVSVR